jgi:16S rRNA (uracil1498-N3)-methyltransferase
MRPRFFIPDLDAADTEAVLPPDESHHLVRVRRLKAGDDVVVFDGRGLAMSARVGAADGARAIVRLGERLAVEPPAPVALMLVQAVLKPDAMDAVVRDATMVGVQAIQPVLADRTTVKQAAVSKGVERWRRVALASAKQAGRARLPEILTPIALTSWLDATANGPRFLLVEPAMTDAGTRRVRDVVKDDPPIAAALIVGPEGGWTADEYVRAIDRGCTAVTLGRLTLRADSVPLAACAIFLAMWDRTLP